MPVLALLEVADESERQPLTGPARSTCAGSTATGGRPDQVLDALRGAALPPGRVHAFVHGEAGLVRDVRRHLVGERGVDRETLSVSGYWRRGRDDEEWRAEKAAERAAEKVAELGATTGPPSRSAVAS